MITLTDTAAKYIANIISRQEGAIGFRLSAKPSGCSGYKHTSEVVEKELPDDIRVEAAQGLTVFIDPQWAFALDGVEIDLVEEVMGQKRLVFGNPNIVSSCGCGESFSLKKDKE